GESRVALCGVEPCWFQPVPVWSRPDVCRDRHTEYGGCRQARVEWRGIVAVAVASQCGAVADCFCVEGRGVAAEFLVARCLCGSVGAGGGIICDHDEDRPVRHLAFMAAAVRGA